jgi:3-oxoacyl-[acyl-carrier protein] reductase
MPLNAPLSPRNARIAVVTGAGRGIGAAIAGKLASLGAHVVLCGRTVGTLKHTASAIEKAGGQSTVIDCDVTERGSVDLLAERLDRTFHRVDIIVNNAGVGGPQGPLLKLAPDAWDRIFNTNLRGVYYMIHALAPLMISTGGGHIINISSLAGKNPLPNGAAYSASKWGLNGLSYSVAEELRGHNIRVAVICPGSVHTEFSPHEGKNSERMLQPEDVAHAVAMLVTQAPQSFMSEVLLRPTQKP